MLLAFQVIADNGFFLTYQYCISKSKQIKADITVIAAATVVKIAYSLLPLFLHTADAANLLANLTEKLHSQKG